MCFVNWVRGFPAVEHSGPPRYDILADADGRAAVKETFDESDMRRMRSLCCHSGTLNEKWAAF